MSAREDQPATIPPPAGEDDAYNAATKVGAMPAEVMARLKAEGLLPDEARPLEEEDQPTRVGAVPAATAPLPPPRPPPRPPSFGDAVPTLHSDVPPPPAPLEELEESEKTEIADVMHVPIDALRTATPGLEQMPQPIPISPSSAYDPTATPQHPSSTQMGTAPIAFPPVGVPIGLGPPPTGPASANLQVATPGAPGASSTGRVAQRSPIPFVIDDVSSASLDSKALGRGRLSKVQLLVLVLALMALLIAGLFVMALISQRG